MAGPATSIILGVLFAAVAALLPGDNPAARILVYLAIVNVAIALFNLLPLYPIDGGRIVHSIAWKLTHDRARATAIAVTLSSALGALLGVGGILLLFTGYMLSGVWLMLLAWFITRMAQAEYLNERGVEPLQTLRCGDLADPPGDALDGESTCDRALMQMTATRRRVLPIVEGTRLLGLCTLSDFSKVAESGGRPASVSAIMTPLAKLTKVSPETDALAAIKQLSDGRFQQLPVINANGELVGFVSGETIRRAVAFSLERDRLGVGVPS